MTLIALFLIQASHAVIVNTGECITASTVAKQCCDDPLNESCLDADAKVLNNKVKATQDSIGRRTAGVHDATEENRAKADLMRTSAQLNLRSADHCEKLTTDCNTKCANLNSSDAKYALSRCQGNIKIVNNLREQAAREEASAKRMSRGK